MTEETDFRFVRKRLPDEAFADTTHRWYPIFDAPHVRSALLDIWKKVRLIETFDQGKEYYGVTGEKAGFKGKTHHYNILKPIHDKIVERANEFKIPHKKCPLCEWKVTEC